MIIWRRTRGTFFYIPAVGGNDYLAADGRDFFYIPAVGGEYYFGAG